MSATVNLQTHQIMLTQFIDLTILKEIGRARLAKFLQPFEPDLKQSNLLLSIPDPDSIGYLAALATLFDSWGLLPDKLRQALLTLEAAAAPQNHDRLQAAIQRRIPRVGVSETCALDRALELWFHAPDELAQFAPPVPIQEPVPENSGDGDSRNTEHAIRNTESASSTIQNPESSIENPESSPAPNLRPPVLHSPPSKVLLTKEGTFDEGGSTLNSQLSPSSGPSINHQLPTINQPQPFPARLLNLPAVTPWGDPVDGKLLLDEIVRNLTRFVVLPRFAPETLALWIVHTYPFQLRAAPTYTALESPAHRCGKSTLVTVLSELANRAVVASNVSSPAFYRVIEQIQPTLLIDEADTFMHGNEELRGILNSGYQKKTAYVLRAVNQVPQNPASAASPTPHSAFPTPHSSSALANSPARVPKSTPGLAPCPPPSLIAASSSACSARRQTSDANVSEISTPIRSNSSAPALSPTTRPPSPPPSPKSRPSSTTAPRTSGNPCWPSPTSRVETGPGGPARPPSLSPPPHRTPTPSAPCFSTSSSSSPRTKLTGCSPGSSSNP